MAIPTGISIACDIIMQPRLALGNGESNWNFERMIRSTIYGLLEALSAYSVLELFGELLAFDSWRTQDNTFNYCDQAISICLSFQIFIIQLCNRTIGNQAPPVDANFWHPSIYPDIILLHSSVHSVPDYLSSYRDVWCVVKDPFYVD